MASIADKPKTSDEELDNLFKGLGIQSQINTELPKVAVMNFGRLNPPTRGHFTLLNYISKQADILGGKGFIFVSASQNYLPPHKGTKWRPVVSRVTKGTYRSNKSNENPLSVWDKMKVLHKFPKIDNLEYINPQGVVGRPYTMDRAADYLRQNGYNDIYLVVGTDRFAQLKQMGVEDKWDITLIEHPRSERLEDLTLYSMDMKAKLHKKHFKTPPQAISGTQARAAAAEHAINSINTIDTMTLRQAKIAINNRTNPMYQGHGFISFKEYMPDNLTDEQLELIIYKLKKGMLLRPSQSYTNNHKKNRMVRRSSLNKKGGKRRKRTRKKRGGERHKYNKELYFRNGQIWKYINSIEDDCDFVILDAEFNKNGTVKGFEYKITGSSKWEGHKRKNPGLTSWFKNLEPLEEEPSESEAEKDYEIVEEHNRGGKRRRRTRKKRGGERHKYNKELYFRNGQIWRYKSSIEDDYDFVILDAEFNENGTVKGFEYKITGSSTTSEHIVEKMKENQNQALTSWFKHLEPLEEEPSESESEKDDEIVEEHNRGGKRRRRTRKKRGGNGDKINLSITKEVWVAMDKNKQIEYINDPDLKLFGDIPITDKQREEVLFFINEPDLWVQMQMKEELPYEDGKESQPVVLSDKQLEEINPILFPGKKGGKRRKKKTRKKRGGTGDTIKRLITYKKPAKQMSEQDNWRFRQANPVTEWKVNCTIEKVNDLLNVLKQSLNSTNSQTKLSSTNFNGAQTQIKLCLKKFKEDMAKTSGKFPVKEYVDLMKKWKEFEEEKYETFGGKRRRTRKKRGKGKKTALSIAEQDWKPSNESYKTIDGKIPRNTGEVDKYVRKVKKIEDDIKHITKKEDKFMQDWKTGDELLGSMHEMFASNPSQDMRLIAMQNRVRELKKERQHILDLIETIQSKEKRKSDSPSSQHIVKRHHQKLYPEIAKKFFGGKKKKKTRKKNKKKRIKTKKK
jgi:nicotinic acid mononucleotide adenylyltransferase